MDPKQFM